jgi:ATP phosphoribosyltransferase regulatory subunit
MQKSLSKLPYGVRYHSGAEARLRRAIEDRVMRAFDGWSYEEIVTPALDYYSLFERGMGRAESQRAFRFTDTDGHLVALRPDVTSGIARAAATLFANHSRPLRFAYAASVWRQQARSHAEWRREAKQLGCELIGVSGAAGDVEMLLVITEALTSINLRERFRVTLNHVGVFNGVAERLALDAATREEMRRLVDVRDYEALQNFLSAHVDAPDDTRAFAKLMQLSGKSEMFMRAREVISNRRSLAALDELEAVWRIIESLNLAESFEIDLGDTANLDYYTGSVFKIYVHGAGAHVGSGGRYDELIAAFGATEPAVGFVLDLEALTDVLRRERAQAGQAKLSTFESIPLHDNNSSQSAAREITGRRPFGDFYRSG